jgi:hypothetical protein
MLSPPSDMTSRAFRGFLAFIRWLYLPLSGNHIFDIQQQHIKIASRAFSNCAPGYAG